MEFLSLLLGTVLHRPYVYGFLLCYLFFAIRHMGLKDTLIYLVSAYGIALVCEYSSTHIGFPFGYYEYFDGTRGQELWVANVPFWDSLSFVFLSYFSWCMAGTITESFKLKTALVTGLLMMALDIVIDPVALLGDRWFLGKVYDYPTGGSYFGVTLSNFAGWFFVGMVIILFIQLLSRLRIVSAGRWSALKPFDKYGAFAVYLGVFLFNIAITAFVASKELFLASLGAMLVTIIPIVWALWTSERIKWAASS